MSSTSVLSWFSQDYESARHKFLAECQARSIRIDSRLNPRAKGRNGEALYTDIALIGDPKANKTLLLLSGTHGVEGYCGSAVQIGWLQQNRFGDLPDDVNVLMVHAMNPYGFSHDRRVTEDNVDLNRNFIDFSRLDLPGSRYGELHDFLLPQDWTGPRRAEADEGLAKFIEERGMEAFQAAVSSGQYHYPNGIFFGGNAPSWSNEMLHSVMTEYLTGKSAVGTIDFHTGLGPHGHGELITIGTDEQKSRAARWYRGDVTDPEAGSSTSAPLDGMLAHGMMQTLSEVELTFITLEFGTFDVQQVLRAVRGDNWLYERGDLDSPLAREIKRDIRNAFYPETDAWKLKVWERSNEVVQMALDGLAG